MINSIDITIVHHTEKHGDYSRTQRVECGLDNVDHDKLVTALDEMVTTLFGKSLQQLLEDKGNAHSKAKAKLEAELEQSAKARERKDAEAKARAPRQPSSEVALDPIQARAPKKSGMMGLNS
jgi:hypothetical protein